MKHVLLKLKCRLGFHSYILTGLYSAISRCPHCGRRQIFHKGEWRDYDPKSTSEFFFSDRDH